MLELIALDNKLAKKRYRETLPALQARLFDLQRRCWEERLGALIVIEGWSTAGKGKAIKKLTERLEPRAFEIHAIREARTHETRLPWLFRFWNRLPNHGELAIFDHSWYRRVLQEWIEGATSDAERSRALKDINAFERTLTDDRYCVTKFFLHIDAAEQERRLARLQKGASTSWRVQPADLAQNRSYEEHRVAIEHALARTETEWAPWTIVESNNGRWARVKIIETLAARLEAALERIAGEDRAAGVAGSPQRSRFEPPNGEDAAGATT